MQIHYSFTAQKELDSLPLLIHERIVKKMAFFASQINPYIFTKKVTGRQTNRFRVGDYRITCDFKNDRIEVLLVERRDKAYKKHY